MRILITGSSGLVGSAVAEHFDALGAEIIGVDNNGRADFFGPDGDTSMNLARLNATLSRFSAVDVDVRDRAAIDELIAAHAPLDLVVHCAGQPSHDLAATRPFDDFDVNAVGTLNLLEAVRRHSLAATFVFLSTNKVYGDRPNLLPLVELETRWEYRDEADFNGIDEDMAIDQSLHSLFGAGKAAADLLVQEYGRYFGMHTACFRCGCLTGPHHAGVPLHGFLSHLVRSQIVGATYNVLGYEGKQVRDNLHAADVASAIEAFAASPSLGAVYNLGGGRANSCSIIEAFSIVEAVTGAAPNWTYTDEPRVGDHICYISDLSRFAAEHPGWSVARDLETTVTEIAAAARG